MKITAGLGRLEDYSRLARAGADEMFAGFVPLSWLEKYGNITPLNRRESLMFPMQFSTMGEMRLLAAEIQDHGVPVCLAFNSTAYLPEQYPIIAALLNDLSALGFQDWILADPALMLHLKAQGLKGRIHLSGEAACFNPDAMAFFRGLGAQRFIFPRKISPEEMAVCIAAAPDCEYEAFILNEKCHYSGAFCNSLHCDELEHICLVPYRAAGPDCPKQAPAFEEGGGLGASGCGICALPRLKAAGVTHLKVVGRGAQIEAMERDVRMLRRALECIDLPEAEIRRAIFGGSCSGNCYYPPISGSNA